MHSPLVTRLVILVCCFWVGTVPAEETAAESPKSFFVFLVTGKAPTGLSPEEMRQLQMDHLGNFSRLAKQGDLQAAGPCGGEQRSARGIVVLAAADYASVAKMFQPDPLVQNGYLRAETYEQESMVGKMVPILDETAGLEQSTIAVLVPGDEWSESSIEAVSQELQPFCEKAFAASQLGYGALFRQPPEASGYPRRIGVLLFRGTEMDQVKERLAALKCVKDKRVSPRVFAQFMAAGTMPKPTANP